MWSILAYVHPVKGQMKKMSRKIIVLKLQF